MVKKPDTIFETFVNKHGGIYPHCEDIEISEQLQEMYLIRKNYLIFTDAGKPIYSRFGDENNLAPFPYFLLIVDSGLTKYFYM